MRSADSRTAHYRLFTPVAMGFLLLSATWVRFYRLGGPSLWHDEAFTWWFARLPWLEMLDTVRLDGVNPPVYYLAVKLFLTWFGDGETSLRLLSASTGVLTVAVAIQLGAKVGGAVGGLTAGWIWAFHPMAVWYSRDARPYALATFLGVLLVLICLTIRERRSPTYWVLAFFVLTLGQLTHYFFFLLAVVLVLFAFLEIRRSPVLFRGWALLALGAFLPLASWLSWYFDQPNPSLGIGWIEPPNITDPLLTLWNLSSGFGGAFSESTLIYGLLVLILAIIGLAYGRPNILTWGSLGLGLVLPLAAVWVLSLRRPVFVDRYFIILLPFVSLLAAFGAKEVVQRLRRYLATGGDVNLAIGVGLVMLAFGNWLGWQVNIDPLYAMEDWRGLVAYFNSHHTESEGVWFSEPEASIPFQYYHRAAVPTVDSQEPPNCRLPCWWVIRQPYTAPHAFSQAVTLPSRPWKPAIPPGCRVIRRWESQSGLALWRVICT